MRCNQCGRGYEHEDGIEFTCEVCGTRNLADGSFEYDCSREEVDRMEERIREYDREYDYYR